MFPGHILQHSLAQQQAAASAKGHAYGLAASDPSRQITINVSSNSISFRTRQDTRIPEVLKEIRRRLPPEELEHPYSITARSRELDTEVEGIVMEFLEPWDAAFLTLRLEVVHEAAPKRTTTVGARLRKALGRETTGRRPSAPPSYEEAVSSGS